MPTVSIADDTECDSCGDRVRDTQSVDGDTLCSTCADEYPLCDRCECRSRDTELTVNDEPICVDCARAHYIRCEHCDLWASETVLTAAGSDICESCTRHYRECDGCLGLIEPGFYCASCELDDGDSGCDLVHGYSYKPKPRFHGDGPLFLGFELEINAPQIDLSDSAFTACEHLGDLGYLKEDSSINGGSGWGFEIVTHPMSYRWAMDHFPWKMLSDLERIGCTATGNGLHVHISRAAFESPAHVYRWMTFLYRNATHVTGVARRVSECWASFDDYDRKHVKDYAKGVKGRRYQAINTQNDDTFELRVFASSLNRQEVQAALGLAAGSVEYTRDLTVPDIVHRSAWEWSAFSAWLGERTEYTPLSRELVTHACAC